MTEFSTPLWQVEPYHGGALQKDRFYAVKRNDRYFFNQFLAFQDVFAKNGRVLSEILKDLNYQKLTVEYSGSGDQGDIDLINLDGKRIDVNAGPGISTYWNKISFHRCNVNDVFLKDPHLLPKECFDFGLTDEGKAKLGQDFHIDKQNALLILLNGMFDHKLFEANIHIACLAKDSQSENLYALIELWAYDVMRYYHNGFEVNDGGYGYIYLDTASGKMAIETFDRITDVEMNEYDIVINENMEAL